MPDLRFVSLWLFMLCCGCLIGCKPITQSPRDKPESDEVSTEQQSEVTGVTPGNDFLAWSKEPTLVENFFRHRHRMVSNVGADGAVSVNREWQRGERPEFYIEQQRYGCDLVIGGIVSGQPDLIDYGIRILDWGFARQGPEGNFPGTGDPMHSTSFMVEGAGRAALALQASGLDQYQDKVAEWIPKVHAAASWMARPEEIARHRKLDLERFTHRYYLRAAALAQAAVLTGDESLMETADMYIDEGLTLQRADGTNPERGGLDVSYQGVGVYYAQLIWLTTHEAESRAALEMMMEMALVPLLERAQEDGSVSTEDSTRANEVGRSGRKKRIAYRMIIPALFNYSKISGDTSYAELAEKMASHAWK